MATILTTSRMSSMCNTDPAGYHSLKFRLTQPDKTDLKSPEELLTLIRMLCESPTLVLHITNKLKVADSTEMKMVNLEELEFLYTTISPDL